MVKPEFGSFFSDDKDKVLSSNVIAELQIFLPTALTAQKGLHGMNVLWMIFKNLLLLKQIIQ